MPLLVLIFWIGLQPRFFLDRMAPTLDESDCAGDAGAGRKAAVVDGGTQVIDGNPARSRGRSPGTAVPGRFFSTPDP